MKKLANNTKFNILITASALAVIAVFSGNLGSGELMGNHVAFGYGGGSNGGNTLPAVITAHNEPLVLVAEDREGCLIQQFTDGTVATLCVPKNTVKNYARFEIKGLGFDCRMTPKDASVYLVGNRLFSITAVDYNNKPIISFGKDLTITFKIPNLNTITANIGLYQAGANELSLMSKANFTNGEVSFKTKTTGTFGLIKADGLPVSIATSNTCQETSGGVVLGIKSYANGSLLRTPDMKIYIVESNKLRYISTIDELKTRYAGRRIYNVHFDVLDLYEGKVLGEKIYVDGSLLRTPDGKIFVIKDRVAVHVQSLNELATKYAGKTIYNVNYHIITFYKAVVIHDPEIGEGSVLRTIDGKLYVIKSGLGTPISLDEYNTKYSAKKIIEVSYDTLSKYEPKVIREFVYDDYGQVLGIKQYADGTLLKSADGKIYVLVNQRAVHITSPAELETKYAGKTIYLVDNATLAAYGVGSTSTSTVSVIISTGQYDSRIYDNRVGKDRTQVLGVKLYAEGTLLRDPSGKVYVVENGNLRHIVDIRELQTKYAGQTIYNVSGTTIGEYQNEGVKKYLDGTLVRTYDWKVYELRDNKPYLINPEGEFPHNYLGRPVYFVTETDLAVISVQ